MLGAIIGDMVGSPYEFTPNNIKTTAFPLFGSASHFTDDTVMTVAMAYGLMQWGQALETQGQSVPGEALRGAQAGAQAEALAAAFMHAMHTYGQLFPRAGYGQKFFMWLHRKDTAPYNSFGNGSAMRVSPVAWAFSTLEAVERGAEISAAVTHNHPEGIKGACATAAAIFLARTGTTQDEIKTYLETRYAYDLSRSLDAIRPGYVHVESCQESVPEAITAFLESTSFEDALRKAVSIGGDSDTIAAITGSIAEGFYGPIPETIRQNALTRLDGRLVAVVTRWEAWLKGRKLK